MYGARQIARAGLRDADPAVRASALAALERLGALGPQALVRALTDPAPSVRRRACELAARPGHASRSVGILTRLRSALDDGDPMVVEAACWALGERQGTGALDALAAVAIGHGDARCREAAIAALGAIGDQRALPAVLHGLEDRVDVRRRTAVALAAFKGPAVETALRRCLQDHDWQVRQIGQQLLEP